MSKASWKSQDKKPEKAALYLTRYQKSDIMHFRAFDGEFWYQGRIVKAGEAFPRYADEIKVQHKYEKLMPDFEWTILI